ncbi:aspartate-semialdehyde dehydrogenase [Pseudomonas benzenivorans]|uniref:Aspartate-semialdehyde dehydrogenase n=1 Tax=Pseudomonas benzenivorans TaxID=556533 RepID=A0ABY5H4Z7_9PSED|nr:aspartate-semialdehyde dehydrogenase [Pseudomonas benzenivorans]UTW07378.1 aspartate-semialdehyde dehydrogenase [Pseudomonas benzenivorans]
MTRTYDVAVIGATGSVGEALVQLLEEREFPVATLYLLGSGESAGESLTFRGKSRRVAALEAFDFSQVRLVFFAAGAVVTRGHIEAARAAGCVVIDLSAALPAQQAPRVVADANPEQLSRLAPPYCVTSPSAQSVAVATVLAALRPHIEVQRAVITACMAVSSHGRQGVSELARQTAELLNARALEPRLFDRQIAFNLLAQVDAPDAGGHGALERRLAAELKEVLGSPQLKVSATCIQVPVFYGDSISLSLQCRDAVEVEQVCAVLRTASTLEYVEAGDYPTVVGDAVGQEVVYVGRVRGGQDDPAELNLWIASDNVRKGAASNAVQLGELLIKHYL